MKLALLYSFEESDWFSCNIIIKNLLASYEIAFGEDQLVKIDYRRDGTVSLADLNKIKNEDVGKIIFLDHKPTPEAFLNSFSSFMKNEFLNFDYYFHIFGDFTLNLQSWERAFSLLHGAKTKFICASRKQKYLVNKFIGNLELLDVCPFPVMPNEFKLDPTVGFKLRDQYKIEKSAKVFLYSGRISYQKRIAEAIDLFLSSVASGDLSEDDKFVITGKFDNLGVQYLGYTQVEGEYFHQIDEVLQKYPDHQDNIIFTGNLQHAELSDYYNMADFYLSLSTYHDEDYGMAVAEALISGLPCFLSDWAGYSSFQLEGIEKYCYLTPVELGKYQPILDLEYAKSSFKEFFTQKIERANIRTCYEKYLSTQACAEKIKTIITLELQNFTTPTSILARLANEQSFKGSEVFRLESNREFNGSYFRIYDEYSK